MSFSEKKTGSIPFTTSRIIEKTGEWRTFKPILRQELCRKCSICFDFCPDGAVHVTETSVEIDYDYCKGCGICSNECPFKAIEMVSEA